MEEKSQNTTYETFIQLIKKWIEYLGANSKLFLEIIEDEMLPAGARTLAAGVLLYIKSPVDLIPDKIKFLGSIDDAIIMIVGLVGIVPLLPEERVTYYRQNYEVIAKIDEYEQIMVSVLGVLWERLVQFVEKLRQRTFRGKATQEVIQSPDLQEALFDETMISIANLNINPEMLDSQIEQLPSPEKVIGLLSVGLEEAQEEQNKDENSVSQAKSTIKKMLLSATGKQDSVKPKTQRNKLLK
jgi:uncharacterized membrane protein YkvA (DUF1232 family)